MSCLMKKRVCERLAKTYRLPMKVTELADTRPHSASFSISYFEQTRQQFIFCRDTSAAMPLFSLKNAEAENIMLPHFKVFCQVY